MSSNSYVVEALLFDMDGTIVDSSIPVHKAWKAWADEHGIVHEAMLKVMPGRRAIETMQILAPHLPQPETVDRFLKGEELDVEGIVEIPGAGAFIASLPAGKWAVVTSATEGIARRRIRVAGLPDPPVLVSADMVSRGKPHPECFLRAAEMLGVAAAVCLAFEDAHAGIAAAKAAGMRVVGVETHYTGAELGVERAIGDFRGARIENAIGGGISVQLG